MRAKVEAASFDEFDHVGAGNAWDNVDLKDQSSAMWSCHRYLGRDATWVSFLGFAPGPIGLSEVEAEQHLLAFAALTPGRYGYIMYKIGSVVGPVYYAAGINVGGQGVDAKDYDDFAFNITHWAPSIHQGPERNRVLRDLYPINLLTRDYLRLPFGDTGLTLQEWIAGDSARGTLEPLAGAEQVTVWRPVVANMPRLREELFRAGLLFYWRHFDPTQPEYRDFSKPFVPPDETPAVYRPEFYAGRDPKVTR